MRRQTKTGSHKLSADSQRLATFASAVVLSASRIEERGWESQLDALLQKLLKADHQDTIDGALDHLFQSDANAYDALMEAAEANSESAVIEIDDELYDALLLAVPILAWTRFSIASGPIAADVVQTLSAHLNAHLLAPNVKLAMAPTLFAIDQLPRSHVEAWTVTQRLAQAALKGTVLRTPTAAPETAPFLADTRYLLAVVVVPAGAPLMRWQASMDLADRDAALVHWQAQAMPTITRLLPGCGIELLLPEAYYVACREGDRQIRPASINAAVHFLNHTLSIDASKLQASIGSFGEDTVNGRADEYRIGFSTSDNTDVVYGVVWPLYGEEDEENLADTDALPLQRLAAGEVPMPTPLEEITTLLRDAGVTNIITHPDRFPLEFCEDCGAPMFPDPEAELVHAEMPEDAPQGATHFH
ncbi:DUF2863 family protein [Actimicrobium antarcticum]|uniref:DUF2863 family protein n=1 Tax=Actimicrobium antarcticum TaxID=1051899 RepID=A0ABP7SQP5_9BURK